MTPRAILFDAGDTLFRLRRSVGEVYAEAAARHGVMVAAAEIDSRFRSVFRRMPPLAFPGVAEAELPAREYRWWKELVAAVFDGIDLADFNACFAELFAYFAGAQNWELFEDVLPALRGLRSRGVRLAIVSNFDGRLVRICEGLGVAAYFETIVMSGRVGVAKPDPRIFRVALRRLGLRETGVVHIGNSMREDVEGARAAGVRGILLARTAEAAGADVIHDLRDLGDLDAALARHYG
ncbi:MAG: HAD-IA family hydrolase [Candidatus Binatia bacterium]